MDREAVKTIIHESAIALIERNPFKAEFQEVRELFESRLNRHEELHILEWTEPYIYFEVKDTRWMHYPCDWRALVSFDITNGKAASLESKNRYQFARRGWYSRITKLIGRPATRYSDCGDPPRINYCFPNTKPLYGRSV